MRDPVAAARALVAREGETVDERDARCIAVRLADEVEALREELSSAYGTCGTVAHELDNLTQRHERLRIAFTRECGEQDVAYEALSLRIAAADGLAEAVVVHQKHWTLETFERVGAALAAYREASK